MFAELFRIRRLERSEGVLSGIEIDLLVVNCDLGRRCRMDRSREEWRLEGDVLLNVHVRGREHRDGDDRCDEKHGVPLLGHEPDERTGDFLAALLARGHVGQDRNGDDAHVNRHDGRGNRGRESESEEDIDPHPPDAGPQQQTRPTEAKQPEGSGHGEDDQDVHRVTAPSGRAGAAAGGCAPLGAAPGTGAAAGGWTPPGAAPGAGAPAGAGVAPAAT